MVQYVVIRHVLVKHLLTFSRNCKVFHFKIVIYPFFPPFYFHTDGLSWAESKIEPGLDGVHRTSGPGSERGLLLGRPQQSSLCSHGLVTEPACRLERPQKGWALNQTIFWLIHEYKMLKMISMSFYRWITLIMCNSSVLRKQLNLIINHYFLILMIYNYLSK